MIAKRFFKFYQRFRNTVLHAYFGVYRSYIKRKIENIEKHPRDEDKTKARLVRPLLDKLERIDILDVELSSSEKEQGSVWEGTSSNVSESVRSPMEGRVPARSSVRGKREIMMKHPTPLTIDSIDFDNEEEVEALTAQVLKEGRKIVHANVQEAIRLGIIDEKGNLLKTELPPDMQQDAETDFGG